MRAATDVLIVCTWALNVWGMVARVMARPLDLPRIEALDLRPDGWLSVWVSVDPAGTAKTLYVSVGGELVETFSGTPDELREQLRHSRYLTA